MSMSTSESCSHGTASDPLRQDHPKHQAVKGGAHGWRFDYSIGGSRKLLSLGTYPDTGLAAARKKADGYRQLVAQGVDPSQLRKSARVQSQTMRQEAKRADAGLPPGGSFAAVARDWLSTIHTAKVSAAGPDVSHSLCRRLSVMWN